MNLYQQFIHISRYARWDKEKNRRETWEETVNRYIRFFRKHVYDDQSLWYLIGRSILDLDVMPSMRALMTAGPALERDNAANYNCAYLEVDSIESLAETMYLLMCGTGVGYSVEKRCVNKLPVVPENGIPSRDDPIVVEDSRIGWCKAFSEFMESLYSGVLKKLDYSLIRSAGSVLHTFGGRASGPEVLEDLIRFVTSTFINAKGRKLTTLECHDIMCKIAEIVICGGTRRSALIALFDKDDEDLKRCKAGNWWETHPYRRLANNSIIFEEKPTKEDFKEYWDVLRNSGCGEPGFFNRYACRKKLEEIGREPIEYPGTNPCSEIILRPQQFCNLTEVVVRPGDTFNGVKLKSRLATVLGVLQSTLTNFRYLRPIWKQNSEEERLLGVSMTGIFDRQLLNEKSLSIIRQSLHREARQASKVLGINQPAAITCIKPSGTVSQLVGCASGIHPRHSQYYIRHIRMSKKDALTKFLIDQGFPNEDCFHDPDKTIIFKFPEKSPHSALVSSKLGAEKHLDIWLCYNRAWCDHKPSCTIVVDEAEWGGLMEAVHKNFDEISGISFLPRFNEIYKQMPFQECSKWEYEDLKLKLPKSVDWKDLGEYEKEDYTKGSREYACMGNMCELL